MTTKVQQAKQAELRDEAIRQLRETFPAGSTVTTIVLHVSQSGMQRAIAVLAPDTGERGGVANLSWQVARATGARLHPKRDGVLVNGAGMDMAFALTYDLATVLHGDGYAVQQRTI